MATNNSIEIVYFRTPGKETCLFVTDIAAGVEVHHLEEKFKVYGLIHVINLVKEKNCAIVRYYTKKAANAAYTALKGGNLVLNSRKSKVQFSGAEVKEYRELPSKKSINLLNHLLGFNGWSSTVQLLDVIEYGVRETQIYCVARAIVDMRFLSNSLCISAHADYESEDPDKSQCISNAKKVAVTNARNNLFKLFGVLLIDDNEPIPFLLDPTMLLDENGEEQQEEIEDEDEHIDLEFLVHLENQTKLVK